MAWSVGWFPPAEWPEAQRRWPDPLADLPDDHRDYSRYIEGRLKWLARDAPGVRYSVSPLTVAELVARGETDDEDGARAALAREILSSGRALPWPPGRNDPCWCGSGNKYKRCCGPAPTVGSDD